MNNTRDPGPRCRICRGELIGKEIPRGICGHDETSILGALTR